MAEQENKELSMAEILASIRKILEESGADEALRRKEAEEEVFELQPSMIVREEPAPAAKPEIPSAVPGRLISEARGRVCRRQGERFFFARSYCRPAGRKSCRGSGRRKSGRRKKHSGGKNGFAAGSFRRGTR